MKSTECNMLRRQKLAVRDKLSPEMLGDRSLSITDLVLDLPVLESAAVVLVYMHFRSEVRTITLINRCLALGKIVGVPTTVPDQFRLLAVRVTDPEHDVAPGFCGIQEPLPGLLASAVISPRDIDVVIAPGSVFDRGGGRLGYGGGYYDRFLALEAPQAVRIGLAFALQLVDKVPMESHDQFMDFVVTENNIFDCRRFRHAPNSSLPQ